MRKMTEAVLIALNEAKRADPMFEPTALRIHPQDWTQLRSEIDRAAPFLSPDAKRYMGMIPLIDRKAPRHFPTCVGPKEAADAIEGGARQWP